MESNIIRKFCHNLDTKLLDKLTQTTQNLLIQGSYICLVQKYGNQQAAIVILEHFGEIEEVEGTIIYKGSFDLEGIEALKRMGVVTIPVIPKNEISDIRERFLDTLREFPEYKRNPDNPDLDSEGNPLVYVLGGFAALGNPASFHNLLVRELRQRCYETILPLFQQMIQNYANKNLRDNTKFEMLIDRMLYRLISQKPVPESWHRDVMPKKAIKHNDEIYGGWLNLDTQNQYFSCIPGSHLGVSLSTLDEGFATIPKDLVDIIGKHRFSFPVPPGHIVIFPQYILHEVVGKKTKHDMMRLFTGWRTTISNDYLHSNMLDLLETQSIIPLPGGMLPPMYASNHGSFFLRKQFKPIPEDDDYKINTIEWSHNSFQPKTLVDKPANKDNPPYKIVARYLKSLEYYGFPKYPPYKEKELALYRPNRIT